jgi:hypothetical protein
MRKTAQYSEVNANQWRHFKAISSFLVMQATVEQHGISRVCGKRAAIAQETPANPGAGKTQTSMLTPMRSHLFHFRASKRA